MILYFQDCTFGYLSSLSVFLSYFFNFFQNPSTGKAGLDMDIWSWRYPSYNRTPRRWKAPKNPWSPDPTWRRTSVLWGSPKNHQATFNRKSLEIAFLDGILPKMSGLRECNYFRLHGYTFCRVPGMFIGTIAHTKSRSIWRISEQWISKKRVLLDVFVRRVLEVVSLSVARIGFLCICSVEGATVRLWRWPHDSIHIRRWLDRKLTFLSVLFSLSHSRLPAF